MGLAFVLGASDNGPCLTSRFRGGDQAAVHQELQLANIPPLPEDRHRLMVDEVRLLWSFVHGDIMDGQARQALRASWGLCDRHAWAHAIVEIELWQYGPGRRGGHQPFDVAVLNEDLLDTAVTRLRRSHRRGRERILRGTGNCPICRDLMGPTTGSAPLSYAGSNSQDLAAEANRIEHFAYWITETEASWRGSVCPGCVRDMGGVNLAAGVTCRRHLLHDGQVPDGEIDAAVAHLSGLRVNLALLIESMTDRGRRSTPAADSSWVEALGWFHGWEVPLTLSK